MPREKCKYYIGIDWAIKPKWWKRLLVWLGLKKRDWDYSCLATWKYKNGIRTLVDIRYL